MNTERKFQKRIGVNSNEYDYLLEEAKDFILAYTKRTESQWLTVFNSIQIKIAVIAYNRLGMEGIESRREGDISTSFGGITDYPESILFPLNSYRLIKGVKK